MVETGMEPIEKKSCTYGEEEHPHGAEVSEEVRSLICIDGKWVNKDDLESQGC